MSANDILDVLNVQRDDKQPVKKKQKLGSELGSGQRQSGMARELYNLIGPNTPPVNLSSGAYNGAGRERIKLKPSPWTKVSFQPKNQVQKRSGIPLHHWQKGSKELLEQEGEKPYFFDKFNVKLDIPELVDEETFDSFMEEIKEKEQQIREEKERRDKEKKELEENEEEKEKEEKEKDEKDDDDIKEEKMDDAEDSKKPEDPKDEDPKDEDSKDEDPKDEDSKDEDPKDEDSKDEESKESKESKESNELKSDVDITPLEADWSYTETKYLFELCDAFELKWHIIHDRYTYSNRSLEDLKEQFYRICLKIIENQDNVNPSLAESLRAYSKSREVERKQYLENLLKRTPAEIAEEESLVIEARRFELAAKKMLIERSHLLTLLDSPQTTQSVQHYQSSQGLANLYNNLMIIDKHQKKRQLQQQQKSISSNEPVPPPIPIAASSSFKKDRSFQTHLQQYLSSLIKQNQNPSLKHEANAMQQLLAKRLTQKEEEAYGLYFHGSEKLTAGVILRSTQKLPGLQQKQSVLKSVNAVLQELDIPTAGGTSWKPVMPTRKTMTKYDELLRSVVALLEVKRGKDKLEAELRLIKSQRGLQ